MLLPVNVQSAFLREMFPIPWWLNPYPAWLIRSNRARLPCSFHFDLLLSVGAMFNLYWKNQCCSDCSWREIAQTAAQPICFSQFCFLRTADLPELKRLTRAKNANKTALQNSGWLRTRFGSQAACCTTLPVWLAYPFCDSLLHRLRTEYSGWYSDDWITMYFCPLGRINFTNVLLLYLQMCSHRWVASTRLQHNIYPTKLNCK